MYLYLGCFCNNSEKGKKMKRIVNILALFLLIFTLAAAMISCGDDTDKEPEYTDYTVTVTDPLGRPTESVKVVFTTPDGEEKTRFTDENGIASLKNVIEGNYKVKLEQGFSNAVITDGEFDLTAEKTDLSLVLRDATNSIEIFGSIADGHFASGIMEGNYSIPCEEGKTSYFVFYAQRSGIYRITGSSTDETVKIGYYGIPMFVQTEHCDDGAYDGKSFELIIRDNTTPYVFGIDTSENVKVDFTIERIGDAPFDPMYAEWVEVTSTATLEKCDTTGKTLVDVDIASQTLSVSLGADGYYYTNDGKLIYIRITSASGHGRIDESFQFNPVLNGSLALLAGHVDANVGTNFGGYVYDANGNFVNKYRYNEMVKTYMDYTDSTYGVVPLTEEFANALMVHGEFNGWWDSDSFGYLFEGINVNPDNAWLFLCMVEQ